MVENNKKKEFDSRICPVCNSKETKDFKYRYRECRCGWRFIGISDEGAKKLKMDPL